MLKILSTIPTIGSAREVVFMVVRHVYDERTRKSLFSCDQTSYEQRTLNQNSLATCLRLSEIARNHVRASYDC